MFVCTYLMSLGLKTDVGFRRHATYISPLTHCECLRV